MSSTTRHTLCLAGLLFVVLSTTVGAQGSCQTMQTSLCSGLPYSEVIFPNALGHQTQEESLQELNQYHPLIQVNCSPSLRMFLCSLYMPVCTILETPLPPCKSLCEAARDGCSPLMAEFGFDWPFGCDEYPATGLCLHDVVSEETDHANCEPMLEDVKSGFCRGVSYETTIFPNLVGQTRQEDAALEIASYSPLMRIQCSSDLGPFLCGVYFPTCSSEGSPVPPCRSLCKSARAGCLALMQRFGFSWPKVLDCDNFPETGPCVGPGGEVE